VQLVGDSGNSGASVAIDRRSFYISGSIVYGLVAIVGLTYVMKLLKTNYVAIQIFIVIQFSEMTHQTLHHAGLYI